MKKILSLVCALALALVLTEGASALTPTLKSNTQLAQFVGVGVPTTPAEWTNLISVYSSFKTQLEAAAAAANAAPKSKVLSPNGGEVLKNGQSYTIKWEAVADNVDIRLAGPSGTTDIKTGVPNTGSYTWTVSAKDGVNKPYQIAIRANKKNIGSSYDVSDSTFQIVSGDTTASSSPVVTFVSANTSVTTGQGTNDDIGTFQIKYKVKAVGSDVYVYRLPTMLDYVVDRNGVSVASTTSVLEADTNAMPTTKGNYRIPKGGEMAFTLTVTAALPQAGNAGQYRLTLQKLSWAPTETSSYISLPLGPEFKTSYQVLNMSTPKKANSLQATVQRAIENLLYMFGN